MSILDPFKIRTNRGRKPGLPRDWEMQRKAKAFAAARLVLATGMGHVEAAAQSGSSRKASSDALLALRYGTPEEIEQIESGKLGLGPFLDQARARIPAEARKKTRKSPKVTAEWRGQWDTEMAMFNHLRDALNGLCSLPRPADVIPIMKKNGAREKRINEQLIQAFDWLTEFSDAWTK